MEPQIDLVADLNAEDDDGPCDPHLAILESAFETCGLCWI
jgi:hypothetical protein